MNHKLTNMTWKEAGFLVLKIHVDVKQFMEMAKSKI